MFSNSKARKGSNRAAKERKLQGFLNLCAILAEDQDFLILLTECTDPAPLNTHVFMRALEVTDHGLKLSKTNAFTKVKTLLGSYSCNKLPAPIQVLHQSFRVHTSNTKKSRLRAEFRKNRTAKRIGFHPTASLLINSIKPIYLSKLSTPHPTPKAYVYERILGPKPKAPNVTDKSCGKCDTFLPLTESKLQCTIPSTDSAIIRDQNTKQIIAVVI